MGTHPVAGQPGPVQFTALDAAQVPTAKHLNPTASGIPGTAQIHGVPTNQTLEASGKKTTAPHIDAGTPSATPSDRPKPKKRGRKPKKRVEDPELDDYEELDEDGLPKDPRRRRVLERNRVAATKCRLRKRDEASALATQEQSMEDQHRYLSSLSDSLTSEILHLKNQLLQHTDCNCTLIQRYIAHQAKRSVDDMLGMTPMGVAGDSMSPDFGRSSTGSSSTSMMTSPEAETMHTPWPKPSPLATTSVPGMLESQSHLAVSCADDLGPLPMVPDNTVQVSAPAVPLHNAHFDTCQGALLVTPQQSPMDGMMWDPTWGPPR